MASVRVLVRRSLVGAAFGLLLAAGPMACSSDEAATAECSVLEPEAGATSAEVSAKNMQFRERCLEVEPGSLTVDFTNDDKGIAHNFRVKGNGIDESTEVKAGTFTEQITLDLTEPGVYDFMCDPHPQMTGRIVVVDPDTPDTTAP